MQTDRACVPNDNQHIKQKHMDKDKNHEKGHGQHKGREMGTIMLLTDLVKYGLFGHCKTLCHMCKDKGLDN
jgi:hypothetical protein